MAISSVSASADFTLNATTDTLIGDMTLTPGAGDYLAVFTMDIDNLATQKALEFSIYVGGAILQHTERRVDLESSIAVAGNRTMVVCTAQVTPTAGQAVEARYRVSTASSTAKKRTLTLFPKASADLQQATGTSEVTVNSGTDTQITGMTLTPGAGTYLLVFSTSATNVSVGSTTNRLHYSVYVNGVQQAHTARRLQAEASISALLGAMPGLIACKVAPTAGQVVEIRAHRDGTTDWTIHERTLTLMKVADADIKEASATADEADTGVADELLVGMTITDPGAATWLSIFSTSYTYGSIAANETAIYSLYNAGVQDANSERQMTHDSGIDNSDYYAFCHGVLTVAGSTDDVELRWRGASSASRTAHERTIVMVREATAKTINAATGSYAKSGVAATLVRARLFNAATGSYTHSGVAATLVVGRALAGGAVTGSYAYTGVAATFLRTLVLNAATGSYALTGVAATLVRTRLFNAATGSYAISGVAATLVTSVGDTPINAATGSYADTGVVATLVRTNLFNAATGSISQTGVAATLVQGRALNAETGSYTYSGVAATITLGRLLNAATGSYALTGVTATVVVGRALNSVTGSYAKTGVSATLARGIELSAETGSYTNTGVSTTFFRIYLFNSATGSYSLTGETATVAKDVVVAPIVVVLHNRLFKSRETKRNLRTIYGPRSGIRRMIRSGGRHSR